MAQGAAVTVGHQAEELLLVVQAAQPHGVPVVLGVTR